MSMRNRNGKQQFGVGGNAMAGGNGGGGQYQQLHEAALLGADGSGMDGVGGGGIPPGARARGGAPASPPVSAECTRLSRRLNVCITGTLSNFFAEGHGAAIWKPLDGRSLKIFGQGSEVTDLASSINALRNAYIVSCRLLEYRSTFPVPLGVSMSCIPNNELTETGDRYAFTALPLSSNTHPHVLFEADASQSEGFEWRKSFPEYTEGNLDTHNILEVQGCPYVFVHEKHPVIHLLRANPEMLGSEIDGHTKIDGEWFKVSKQVLGTCCATLRAKVLSRISFNDLNLFQVQLKRIDAKDWTDIGEVLQEHIVQREEQMSGASALQRRTAQWTLNDDAASTAAGSTTAAWGRGGGVSEDMSVLDRPCSFMARFELTYEIPH